MVSLRRRVPRNYGYGSTRHSDPIGARPAGTSTPQRRSRWLIWICAAPILAGAVAWQLVPEQPSPEPPPPATPARAAAPAPERRPDTRLYAVAATRVAGLDPGSEAGIPLELWVTWGPPITEEPEVQLLVPDARLFALKPSQMHDASAVAVLEIPEDALPDLLFADSHGLLSAAVPGAEE